MMKQWDWRQGLELIKQKHYLFHNPNDKKMKADMKAEIQNYLAWVKEQQDKELLKDVYITDNKPKTPKYVVNNDKELEAFMRYQESLEGYNAGIDAKSASVKKRGKYRKGSLAQRLFEPMVDAEKDADGSYFVKVDAQEITKTDEETLRRLYENAKTQTNEICDAEPDADEFREKLMADLESDSVSLERWNDILAEELGVFKREEQYNFATDLRRNFDDVLAESLQDKIFKTIPAHVFWDIKKPLNKHLNPELRANMINPTRQHHVTDFFDLRSQEEWRANRKTKRDLNPTISRFTRY
jgi:hypothetical protein